MQYVAFLFYFVLGCTVKFDHHLMYCSTRKHDGRKIHEQYGKSSQYSFDCCKNHSFCNNGSTWPELAPVPTFDYEYEDTNLPASGKLPPSITNTPQPAQIVVAIIVPVVVVALLLAIIVFIMKRCHNIKMKNLASAMNIFQTNGSHWERNLNGDAELLDGIRFRPVGDSTLRAFGAEEDDLTSGSGSGMPQLVQRTLAKQIQLQEVIGKGRYGKVHKGRWNGENIAVKIFLTKDEFSYNREIDIYSTVLLRHENILEYVGSDVTSLHSCTQFWLVTRYYQHGSLYDFLKDPARPYLTTCQAYGILHSCLRGLVHLHQEIFGTNVQNQDNYKPAIAHRDIKSKNILVRDDGFSCVIADFGLAATYNSKEHNIDVKENYRVGTKRYMAPEVLSLKTDDKDKNPTFESYKKADVYSWALVMWEVVRRTQYTTINMDNNYSPTHAENEQPLVSEDENSYALPYHLDVGPDPSFDEMIKVVCLDKKRPRIPAKWSSGQNNFFAGLSSIMRECWHEKPDVRHSMLRIKKNLSELQNYAIQLDKIEHNDNSAGCYFSVYGPILSNQALNSHSHNNFNENPGLHGRGAGFSFSRHSITGGGHRAMGDLHGSGGSGSVNSTATQSSYCSSGYQSKLGSQSGSVGHGGLTSHENIAAPFGIDYQSTHPTSSNLSRPNLPENESHAGIPSSDILHPRLDIPDVHNTRAAAVPLSQSRNMLPRLHMFGSHTVNPVLDEQDEEGTQT